MVTGHWWAGYTSGHSVGVNVDQTKDLSLSQLNDILFLIECLHSIHPPCNHFIVVGPSGLHACLHPPLDSSSSS